MSWLVLGVLNLHDVELSVSVSKTDEIQGLNIFVSVLSCLGLCVMASLCNCLYPCEIM